MKWFWNNNDSMGRPIMVASHPRSGTHLTIDLLRKQFEACKSWVWPLETPHHLYLSLGHLPLSHSHTISRSKAKRILRRPDRPIIKTHDDPDFADLDRKNRAFAQSLRDRADLIYVVRDGRDVMASTHVWIQHSRDDARRPFSEFLRYNIGRGTTWPEEWARHVRAWTHLENVFVLRFEDIVAAPRETIAQLSNQLQLSPRLEQPYLPEPASVSSRWADYWRRLVRDHESTAISGRYNNQEPVDWRAALDEEDRRLLHEKIGDLLIELGYESDPSWIEA
jgi:hypothetical protein